MPCRCINKSATIDTLIFDQRRSCADTPNRLACSKPSELGFGILGSSFIATEVRSSMKSKMLGHCLAWISVELAWGTELNATIKLASDTREECDTWRLWGGAAEQTSKAFASWAGTMPNASGNYSL